ncbi:ABC transporter substrate-binding protein [Gordonia hydrophobica]|uniref:ABC transporter substrate-binding protein n=1 Tax=Gordonia hydrophobica TaxID=40516 RepID=A0ABZ2U2Q5_9ACTN|nr:ABC transporter substrate-binding protein [Gordonia hydrophobica]MBM7368987.1 polar amino acid transport system substrate-binding protein [Gordonia hydrophobica]
MRISLRTKRIIAVCAAVPLALGAAACSSGDAEHPSSSSASAATPIDAAALHAQLPERVRTSGTLIVSTSAPFPPLEFVENGKLVGFDIDVVTAIAQTLGVKADIRQVPFPQLIASVQDGRSDLAARGLFDTKQREEQVDLVSYFSAGTQWTAQSAKDVDPDSACGLKVGAEVDTTQLTLELPAKSTACEAVGEEKIDIVTFDSETTAMEALTRGEVDAVSADSPVALYAVKQSDGKLKTVDHAFDTQPYSFPVAKDSPLGPVLKQVVQHLIDTGEIDTIADRWGLTSGLIQTSVINAAID